MLLSNSSIILQARPRQIFVNVILFIVMSMAARVPCCEPGGILVTFDTTGWRLNKYKYSVRGEIVLRPLYYYYVSLYHSLKSLQTKFQHILENIIHTSAYYSMILINKTKFHHPQYLVCSLSVMKIHSLVL